MCIRPIRPFAEPAGQAHPTERCTPAPPSSFFYHGMPPLEPAGPPTPLSRWPPPHPLPPAHPTLPRSIKLGNAAFQQRVASVEGSLEILELAGFQARCLFVGGGGAHLGRSHILGPGGSADCYDQRAMTACW